MVFEAFEEETEGYFQWGAQDKSWKVDGDLVALNDLKKFAIDPHSIQTGWGYLAAGQSPDWQWADIPGTKTNRPGEDYKPAVHVDVYLTEKGGSPHEGWRPWTTNGAGARDAIKAIWKDVHEGATKNEGKIAVVKVAGCTEKKYKNGGSTRIPTLEVAGWIKKPDAPEPVAQVEAAPAEDNDDDLF